MKTLLIALYPYHGAGLDSWHDHGAGMTYTHAFNAGHDITFLDMKKCGSDEELREAMEGYDLIAFGLKSSYYRMGMKVVDIAKSLGQKVIIGGYHATAAIEELTEHSSIDWILQGESEITFPKFLSNPTSFPRVIRGERPENLDDLDFMDRWMFSSPTEDCSGWWYGGRRKMISVAGSRGCPYKCSFCQPIEDNHFGTKLRRRSVKSLISELLQLKQMYHPECVMIHDDTFFLQPRWLEEFCDEYPKVGLPFWASTRADGICKNPTLFNRLVSVGWELVSVGFESGSQRILDKLEKGTTVEENLEAAKIIRSSGAKIYANYMLGIPWETKADVQATVRMADEINAEKPSWAFFTPYPGSKSGEECIQQGWSLLDRHHYDRRPDGQKVKGVDYLYLVKSLQGFREVPVPVSTDIIIPTYENEQLTLECLAAINENTTPGTYRIILVDNGTKDYSKVELAVNNLGGLFIHLDKNVGFVDAVNLGLKNSIAPNICFLNNDTRVTPRWLDKLSATLHSSSEIGIVGPLTGFHKIGADSHHSLVLHRDLLPPLAKDWTFEQINAYLEANYPGRSVEISFVAFLCGMMKREVYEQIGLLDTAFAFGMWDDVDYNMSAQKLGYKTVLCIDTCIYHRGRSTFSLLEKTQKLDVGKLLRTNKEYLDRKWAPPGSQIRIREVQKKTSMRMV